jgi:asparagine synthetase B (glutamine-hydrolysing)
VRSVLTADIALQSTSQTLYWARDALGRRSLLQARTADGQFLLSSVSCAGTGLVWEEVDASCVYSLNLAHGKVGYLTNECPM